MVGSSKSLVSSAALWCLVLWQASCEERQGLQCAQLHSPCLFSCQENEGDGPWFLDLTSLQPQTEMQPVFKDVLDTNGANQYSYSPCTAFTEGPGCAKGTAVCQRDPLDPTMTHDVGDSNSVVLYRDPASRRAWLTYRKTLSGALTKITQVNLICEENKTNGLQVQGEVTTDNYVMNLTGPAACFSHTTPSTTPEPASTTSHLPATTEPAHVTTEPHDVTTSPGNATEVTTHTHEITTHDDVTTAGKVTTHHTAATTTGEDRTSEAVSTATHGTDRTTGTEGSSTHTPTSTRQPVNSTARSRLSWPLLFLLLATKLALSS